MTYATGIETEACTRLTCQNPVFASRIKSIRGKVTVSISHRRVSERRPFLTFTRARSNPASHVVVEIVFSAQGPKGVLGVGVGPALRHTLVSIRCRGDRHTGTDSDIRLAGFHFMLLVAQISRNAQTVTAIVSAQRQQRQLARLTVNGGVTIATRHIQTHTNAIIGEPAGKITGGVVLTARANTGGHLVQRLVGRPFGHNIDRPAQTTAARRRTVKEGIGAAQYFNPLDKLGAHVLTWQQTVQPVVGNIVRVDRQAAHHINLLEVAKATGHAYRRVVQQHLADAGRLLILNQRLGVAGRGEGGVHVVLVTQNPHTRAGGHLATRVGLRQPFCGGISAGADGQ